MTTAPVPDIPPVPPLNKRGYAKDMPGPRPEFDSALNRLLQASESPWGPTGHRMRIGVLDGSGERIYRVMDLWGMSQWIEVTQAMLKMGFKDLLGTHEGTVRGLDAAMHPTEKVVTSLAATTSEPAEPLADIESARGELESAGETEREQLVQARMGQGRFRQLLLEAFGSRCVVTGVAFEPLLRASHLKPWRDGTNADRLSVHNGLLLRADVDALFDAGYISFADYGALLVSPDLPEGVLARLGVAEDFELPESVLTPERQEYLRHHSDHVFRA